MRPEDVLIESEGFAYKVLNASLNGIYIHDVTLGQNVFINKQYTTITGYTLDDLKNLDGTQFFELFHPDDRKRVAEHMEKLVGSAGETLEIEYRFKTRDQRWIWCLSRDSVFAHNPHDSVCQIIGTFLDITDRKRSEASLKKSEQRYRKLFQNHHAVMLLIDPLTGDIINANPAACAYYGYTLKEINGLKISDINIQTSNQIRSEMHLAKSNQCRQFFFKHRLADGQIRDVEVFSGPIFTQDRELLYSIVHDITERKRAERALRESEQLYRAIGETIPYGVWVTDASGYCTYASPSFLEMVGMTMDQIQKFGWLHLLPPEDVEPTKNHWLHCVRTGAEFEHEHRFKSSNGSYRSVLAIGRPVRDEGGNIIKWAGINLDIDNRKRMENDLRESRAKLETALASMTDAVFISDAEGRLINFNDAFASFHRFSDKDGCFKTFAEYPDILDVFTANGEPVPLDQWMVPRALRGEAVTNAEHFLRRKDTGETWVGSYSFGPIRDQDGAIVGSVVVGRDITVRKKFEEELRRLSHFPEENPNPVLRCTPDGETLYANTSARNWLATFGWQTDRVLPEPLRVTVVEAGKQNHTIETEISDPAGRTFSIFAIQPPGEDYINLYGIDLTDRKRAEKALKRSNAELEQFAYVASHDLQEPLRAVVGFLQLLQSRCEDQIDEKGRHYIERSLKAGHRMQTLIRELLTLSRVNTKSANFATTDLNQIFKEVLANLQSIIEEKKTEIWCAELPSLNVDAAQVQSLFQNLIVNAVRYNESPKSNIEIGCREHEHTYDFFVKDNGIGISPQFHQRIFKVFQRLHTDREYPGTGLGLALCKKIVERHGGTIWVESRLHEGSVFHFTLPRSR
jgi:PAS domain S-box-containing protein